MAGSIERLRKGMLTFLVLEALQDRPLYAYQIIKAIEGRTRGHYKPSTGSIYPVLKKLVAQGAIRVVVKDHKKYYEITDEGKKLLNELKSDREEFRREFLEGPKKALLDKLIGIGLLLKENRKHIDDEKVSKIVQILGECETKIRGVIFSSS